MDGDLNIAEPTDAMLDAGVEELALALPEGTDTRYARNLCRIIWRVMAEAVDA